MKSATTALMLLIGGLALGVVGCGTSAPPRFYTISSTATAGGSSASGLRVLVGPVSIPAAVDRPQMVVTVPPNGVEVDEFNQWSAPLSDMIARAVASDLAGQLRSSEVTSAPLANFNPAYKVTINVQRFESVRGQNVTIEAVWTVADLAHGGMRSGSTLAQEGVQGDTCEAIAAAQSRAVARLSGDLAVAIQAEPH